MENITIVLRRLSHWSLSRHHHDWDGGGKHTLGLAVEAVVVKSTGWMKSRIVVIPLSILHTKKKQKGWGGVLDFTEVFIIYLLKRIIRVCALHTRNANCKVDANIRGDCSTSLGITR